MYLKVSYLWKQLFSPGKQILNPSISPAVTTYNELQLQDWAAPLLYTWQVPGWVD